MASVIKQPISAGGLLLRPGNGGGHEVLLVLEGGVWRIPKGMQDASESLPATAIREVLEETGFLASVIDELHVGHWTYTFDGVECSETCTYYAMIPGTDSPVAADGEVEMTRWVSLSIADGTVEFEDERSAVKALADVLRRRAWPWDVTLAKGQSLGVRLGEGPLCLSRESAIASIDRDMPPVLVLRSFRPSDAALIGLCAGVGSLTEGPASHVSVVAAARNIPCVTAVRGVELSPGRLLSSSAVMAPEGAWVRLDERSARISLGAAAEPGAATTPADTVSDSRENAWSWATQVARLEGLSQPTNWKLFKRDLLARWFTVPQMTRFTWPWSVPDVLDRAQALVEGTVRVSAFPREIACHATSFVLDRDNPDAFAASLLDVPDGSDLVLFVQEGTDNLCWRLVLNRSVVTVEAGVGQAMYVFEEERGRHPIGQGSWTVGAQPSDWTSSGDARCDALLAEFLQRRAPRATENLQNLADRHRLDVVAVEGYFRWRTGEYVACDLDLPQDWNFMA